MFYSFCFPIFYRSFYVDYMSEFVCLHHVLCDTEQALGAIERAFLQSHMMLIEMRLESSLSIDYLAVQNVALESESVFTNKWELLGKSNHLGILLVSIMTEYNIYM